MKKILITLLITASFSTFADEIINLTGWKDFDFTLSDFCYVQPNVQERQGVLYFPNEEVGITDTSLCFFKDAYGQYESKGNLKNGKKEGKWTYWFKNGQKRYESTYKDGKVADGKDIAWYSNGQKMYEFNYKDGNKAGPDSYWYRDGQLAFLVRVSIDGKEETKSTFWYENGQIKSETHRKDGKREGKWTYWDENGQIKSEAHFKDNKRDGKWTYWDENGQIKAEAHFKDGVCISGDCD